MYQWLESGQNFFVVFSFEIEQNHSLMISNIVGEQNQVIQITMAGEKIVNGRTMLDEARLNLR